MEEDIDDLRFWQTVDGQHPDLRMGISHGMQYGLLEYRSSASQGRIFMAGITIPRTGLLITEEFSKEQWETITKAAALALRAYQSRSLGRKELARFL